MGVPTDFRGSGFGVLANRKGGIADVRFWPEADIAAIPLSVCIVPEAVLRKPLIH